MNYAPVRQPLSVTLLIVAFILVLIGVEQSIFIAEGHVASGYTGVCTPLIDYLFGNARPFIDRISIVLLFGVALYTIRISVGKMVLGVKCYLSALFYMLFVAVVSGGEITFETGLVAIIFAKSGSLYIQAFRRDISSYDFIFRAGFTLGVTPLLFGQMALLFPLTIVACMAFRRSLREYILTIVGYMLPIIIYAYICLIFDYNVLYVPQNIWEGIVGNIQDMFSIFNQPLAVLIFIGLYLLLALLAMVSFFSHIIELRNSTIRMFSLFVAATLFSIVMMLFPNYSATVAVVAAMPLAIVIPAFFATFRGWFSWLCYLAVLLFGVAICLLRIAASI